MAAVWPLTRGTRQPSLQLMYLGWEQAGLILGCGWDGFQNEQQEWYWLVALDPLTLQNNEGSNITGPCFSPDSGRRGGDHCLLHVGLKGEGVDCTIQVQLWPPCPGTTRGVAAAGAVWRGKVGWFSGGPGSFVLVRLLNSFNMQVAEYYGIHELQRT